MENHIVSFLDENIRDLQELKRMAANPYMVDAMRRILADLDGGAPRTHNGLTASTLDVIRSFDRPFTVPDIVKALKESGFEFAARKPGLAVAAPLKRLEKRGLVRMVKARVGNEPHLYEYIGSGAASAAVAIKVGESELWGKRATQ